MLNVLHAFLIFWTKRPILGHKWGCLGVKTKIGPKIRAVFGQKNAFWLPLEVLWWVRKSLGGKIFFLPKVWNLWCPTQMIHFQPNSFSLTLSLKYPKIWRIRASQKRPTHFWGKPKLPTSYIVPVSSEKTWRIKIFWHEWKKLLPSYPTNFCS